MEKMHSCANCAYNLSQYENVGTKIGICSKHKTFILNSKNTTCFYNFRKDLLPEDVIESRKEHIKLYPKEPTGIHLEPSEKPKEFESSLYTTTNLKTEGHLFLNIHGYRRTFQSDMFWPESIEITPNASIPTKEYLLMKNIVDNFLSMRRINSLSKITGFNSAASLILIASKAFIYMNGSGKHKDWLATLLLLEIVSFKGCSIDSIIQDDAENDAEKTLQQATKSLILMAFNPTFIFFEQTNQTDLADISDEMYESEEYDIFLKASRKHAMFLLKYIG